MDNMSRTDDSELLDRLVEGMDPSGYAAGASAGPPAGLFDRIEDATSVPVVAAPTIVEYSIDCNDMVVNTGGDWDRFATENDADELAVESPKLSLWNQIDGADARSVWQLVVAEVRRSATSATVPFRCDSPGMRRWYKISVSPGEDGSVNFRSEMVFEEVRPDVTLVARGADRDDEAAPIEVCCWCARGFDGSRWISLDELVWSRGTLEDEPVPEVRQGICRECADSMGSAAQQLKNL